MDILLIVLCVISLVFAIFFVVNLLVLTQSKIGNAKLISIEKSGIKKFANYEVEGKQLKNAYPTDSFSEKMIKRSEINSVRVVQCFGKTYVFDKVSVATTWVGTFAFVIMSVMLVCVII